jgi:transcriptional repressor of cell division inhibition gene dicB
MLSALYSKVNNYFTSVANKGKLAYHRTMTKDQAIALAGTSMALAKMLGIQRQAISQWGDEIPQARLWQLKVLRPEWFKKSKVSKQVSPVLE